jgi:hypothetical protein
MRLISEQELREQHPTPHSMGDDDQLANTFSAKSASG